MLDSATEKRINTVLPLLNESQRRKYLAAEAESLGHGGISAISKLTGTSRVTITLGQRENSGKDQKEVREGKVRTEGGGRKSILELHPEVKAEIQALVGNESFGNPQNPLQWTTKSLRNIEEELKEKGFSISHVTIGDILEGLGYSLQLNQKMLQVGKPHPDRDAQFRHINDAAISFMKEGEPVISIDCKKKENIGNFKNNGAEYAPKGKPEKVLDHDFPLPGLGKAAPYGVYDIAQNEGYVSVGISSDTAQFAANSIRSWWSEMGASRYPSATKLYITADGGGSNGSRNRLWKKELQAFANETGLSIYVSHFPPGTSKWNKIEHRMFSQITKNWRGRPLESLEVIISLIASTTTEEGLTIKCGLDKTVYETGVKVSEEELKSINLKKDDFHGEWNYCISPSDIIA